MSRFTVATDLESWHSGQRGDRKARRAGGRARKGKGAHAGGGRQVPARTSGADLVEAVPKREAARGPGPRGPGPRGPMRGRDAMRGEEDEGLHEAELDEQELEPDDFSEDEDLGEEPARGRKDRGERRGLGKRVRDAVTPDWQRPTELGERMRIQTRAGTRAAVVEVKPGLFVVAEVPAESVEFGFGPMLLAPALIKTLGRALQSRRSAGGAGRAHRPELSTQQPKQLPGPTQDETEGQLAPWLDQDIAEELGCSVCVRRDGRKP